MNNNLKFRIYIPEYQRFEYFDLNNFEFSDLSKFHYSDRNLHSKEYPIQQYTGLNDKNNNPIYEGDIVSFSYQSSEHDIEQEIGEVFFSEGIFYFGKSLFASNDSNFITESIEVIGNIFNPPCILDTNGECLICDDIIDNCQFKSK